MSMYSQYQTDPKKEKNGFVVSFGTYRITIARAGGANKQFLKTFNRKCKPYRKDIQAETLDPDIDFQIMVESYSETIVKNWEVESGGKWKQGIESPDGGVMPFNVKNVMKTFNLLPDLLNDVAKHAQEASNYLLEEMEADAKN